MTKAANNWTLTQASLPNFVEFVSHQFLAGRPAVKVKIVPEKRTTDQNSMIYALYGQIAAQCEDQSVIDIRRECKLNYGVPILRASDEVFREVYDNSIMHNLTYDQKLLAMDYMDVTSRMNKKQGTEFIDTVIREYSKRGISIVHPGESR